MFEKILFATSADPTCDHAAKVAFDLARKYESQLTVFHVLGTPTRGFGHFVYDAQTGEKEVYDQTTIDWAKGELRTLYSDLWSKAPGTQIDGESNDWWEELWREDRLDTVGWAAGLIWAGLVLLAQTTGLTDDYGWWDGWAVFFTGAGILVLLRTFIRPLVPEFRRKLAADLIFGFILLSIGLGDLVVDWIWPFALIAVGVMILRGLRTRQS